MADVARDAGVSVASVSNYLNKRPYMSADMARRVAASIERLGYQVNSSARTLRSGRTGLIKLMIPDLRQPYFSELAEDVLDRARAHGYGVIVESTTNSRERELDGIRAMGTNMADGLILSPLLMRSDDVAVLDGDYPLVMLGERLFGVDAPHVIIGNRSGAADATAHLLDAGATRIMVVGAALEERGETSSGLLRTRGHLEALRAHGVASDLDLLVGTEGWGSRDGALAVERALDRGLRFDAVLALNDALAWGVLRGLREHGVDVPGDVRVVGFDDVSESSYMSPSLTTVDPNRPEVARLAVESIVRQIEAGGRAPAMRVEAGHALRTRESSPAS